MKNLILKTVLAQTGGGQNPPAAQKPITIKLPNPLGANSITEILDRLIGALFIIATPIAIIMIIIGAFQILTAGGGENVKKGKKTILYAVIGYAVIIVAKSVSVLIKNILGVQG